MRRASEKRMNVFGDDTHKWMGFMETFEGTQPEKVFLTGSRQKGIVKLLVRTVHRRLPTVVDSYSPLAIDAPGNLADT